MIFKRTYTCQQLTDEEWEDRNSRYPKNDMHMKYILHMVDMDLHYIKCDRRVSNDS